MANTRERVGGIVAFEGHAENVTTQLRLLPSSPHILILPGVQCYVRDEEENSVFAITNFVRNIHDALLNRNKAAVAFLEQSTAENKRLVFMNGGTCSAQALCIRAIMKHHTDGDFVEAQKIFHHLVQYGLHGLEKQWSEWKRRICRGPGSPAAAIASQNATTQPGMENDEDEEDPIIKAMRAADALDRETESLQQSNELDLTFQPRPRCNSLPLYGYADTFNDAAPFFVFGAQTQSARSADIPRSPYKGMLLSPITPRFAVTHYDCSPKETNGYDNGGMTSPSCVGEPRSPPASSKWSPMTMEYSTPRTTMFDLRTPGTSTFRESSLANVDFPGGLHPPPAHRRVRSLDRMFPTTTKYGDLYIDDTASTPTAVATPTPRVETFGYSSIKRGHSTHLNPKQDAPVQGSSLIKTADAIAMKPSRATIIFGPVPKGRKRRSAQPIYVDRGTDAEQISIPEPAFEPLFAMGEDLVIHVKDETSDLVLDWAIKTFKEGAYPILAPPTFDDKQAVPRDDALPKHEQPLPHALEAPAPAATVSPSSAVDEYDPFAYTQTQGSVSTPVPAPSQLSFERPPTPDSTPTPSIAEKPDKFRELAVGSKQTPVTVQNSLRSVLNGYFPPASQGYRQYEFSLLPELEAMWEPIFRQAEPGSPRKTRRRMDQILAIGSQGDVKREYRMSIIGQLENLGKKRSGLSRSGRLDFRYILAAAIQTFTSQPLANQTTNPFNSPYILATLLVPQLETYLALHSEVRYLILEYPPEHLGTVIAMQKLVGVDLMKVAQIIDARSAETLPFTHIRGASISSQPAAMSSAGQSQLPKHAHSGSMVEAHISKANFLLTSTASPSEIAIFLSTVSTILSEVSDFYVPEPTPQAEVKNAPDVEVKKAPTRKAKPAPLQSTFTAFPKPSIAIPTTPTTPRAPPRVSSPAPSTFAPSVSETLRTAKSSRSRFYIRSRSRSRASGRSKQTPDVASMYTFDPAEDSDYDLEERRLMPLFLQKPKRKKGDSRKALKFLGLA